MSSAQVFPKTQKPENEEQRNCSLSGFIVHTMPFTISLNGLPITIDLIAM